MNAPGSAKKVKGFTLIEVMVAIGIIAVIATVSFETLSIAIDAGDASEVSIKRIGRIDRAWILIENDLKHAVGHPRKSSYGNKLKAFEAPYDRAHIFQLFRAGRGNPLNLPRTELARVGYRFEEEVLWRDLWIDPGNVEAEPTTSTKILDDIEEIEVHMLPWTANEVSINGRGWSEKWPVPKAEDLPAAVRIRITLKDRGEITRMFALLKEDF